MQEEFKDNRVRAAYKYLKRIRNAYKPQTNMYKNEEDQIVSYRHF